MTTGSDLRIATLNDARSRRSAEKRAAVEDAVLRLRDSKQAVTFVSVAREAKVSRQYLYNNFADEIGEERVETRAETEVIDGKKVPLRTPEEYRHIEAALRNKEACRTIHQQYQEPATSQVGSDLSRPGRGSSH